MQEELNEKDKIIEELENKIRYQDLQAKKREIEVIFPQNLKNLMYSLYILYKFGIHI